ncbi:MAG: hypothetical protein KIT65_14815 [Xanthobacteraceae bacterium]|nr:hypothetical protein [Xanthobacteraceae bacterium]
MIGKPESEFLAAAKKVAAHWDAEKARKQKKPLLSWSWLWPKKKKEWPPAPDKPMSWAIEYLVKEARVPNGEVLQALRDAGRENKITVAGVRGPNGPGLGQRYGSLYPIPPDHWNDFCIDQSGEKSLPALGSIGTHEGMTYTNLRVNEAEIRAIWG